MIAAGCREIGNKISSAEPRSIYHMRKVSFFNTLRNQYIVIPASAGKSRRTVAPFHYTTAQALIAVLSTQTLFATHADFLTVSPNADYCGSSSSSAHKEFKELAPKLARANLMSAARIAE
jgi:hypothetical protein